MRADCRTALSVARILARWTNVGRSIAVAVDRRKVARFIFLGTAFRLGEPSFK